LGGKAGRYMCLPFKSRRKEGTSKEKTRVLKIETGPGRGMQRNWGHPNKSQLNFKKKVTRAFGRSLARKKTHRKHQKKGYLSKHTKRPYGLGQLDEKEVEKEKTGGRLLNVRLNISRVKWGGQAVLLREEKLVPRGTTIPGDSGSVKTTKTKSTEEMGKTWKEINLFRRGERQKQPIKRSRRGD